MTPQDDDYENSYPWDEEYQQWIAMIEADEEYQRRQQKINILLDGDEYNPHNTINS